MKKYLLKIGLSLFALTVFFIIAVGSLNDYENINVEYLGDGVYLEKDEICPPDEPCSVKNIKGKRDALNKWHGEVIIEHINGLQRYKETEIVTFVHGKRHGKSRITNDNGQIVNFDCYNMDKVVPCDENIISNIVDLRSGLTAVEILEQKYPWYTRSYLFFDDSVRDSFKLFMTAIEQKLNTYTLNNDNFDSYFSEVIGSDSILLPFDNISNWYQLSGRFASGENEAKDFIFRRAVIERYTKTKIPIANIIQNKYPYFSKQVENGFNISTSDFDGFCHEFESKMDLKINIPVSDPFFIDSLDSWMGQLFTEYLEDDNNLIFKKFKIFLSQPTLYYNRYDISVQNMVTEYLQKNLTDTVPVHEAVLILLFKKVLEVDAIKLSIREACLTNQNVPLPPEIVTNILVQNTEGIRVRGLITFDGNAAITRSGIVWDTVYNPELTPNNYINPDNKLDFNVFIDGLIPGKRYFVRSYAVNKVGMVYGNTLEFIAGEVSSNKDFFKEGLSWKVYPNPANNQFNIAFEEPLAKVEVIIYTLNGRDVFHKSYNNIEDIKVNSADWPAGTYSIVLKGPNFKQSKRIILQR